MMVSGGVTGSAAFAWTQRASDNFDAGAPGADLTTSGNWSITQGTMLYHAGGNVVQQSAASDNFYYWNAYSFLSTQYSQGTMVIGSGATVCGYAVRIQPVAVTAYFAMYDGTNVKLVRYNAGSGVTVVQIAKAYVGGEKLRIEAIGAGSATRLTVYEDIGSGFVAIGTMTSVDPGGTYIDNGSPGLFGFNGREGFYLDDWSGGDGA